MNGSEPSVSSLQEKIDDLQAQVKRLRTIEMERGAALGKLYRSFREQIERDFVARKNEFLTSPDPLVRNVALYLQKTGRFPTSREFGLFNHFQLIDPVTEDS